jgi:hypothetical protein
MAPSMADVHPNPPVRGTQLLVEHMSEVFRRPSLLAIEIAWRWLFGIPFLWVCWKQAQRILAAYPLESSGFSAINAQNPWVAAVQLSSVGAYYEPHVLAVLRWLLPAAALVWVVISGLGRNLLLMRIEPRNTPLAIARMPFRPLAVFVPQAGWLVLLMLTFWGWLRSMQWVAATHISVAGEPDLVGYFIWAIFLSLGFFTAFALASWPLSIAPFLALLEKRSALSALGQSLRLEKSFTGKLAEINLVMGIVKLALLVLAMVFSSAPLPFADELGAGALHAASAASVVIYCVANDFFQVVRLKAFVEFWKVFRGQQVSERAR